MNRKSALATAGAVACLFLVPSTASASNADCWGTAGPTVAKKQRDLTYSFQCSDNIKGFSFISSLEVGEFGTVADVIDPATGANADGETFGCEGAIPSDGFGCNGNGAQGHVITGTASLDEARCVKRRNKLRAWVVAIDAAGQQTGPFELAVPRCPKTTKTKKSRH